MNKNRILQNRYNVLQHKSDFAGFYLSACKFCSKYQKNTPPFVKKDGVKNFLSPFLTKKALNQFPDCHFYGLFLKRKVGLAVIFTQNRM